MGIVGRIVNRRGIDSDQFDAAVHKEVGGVPGQRRILR